MPGSEAAAKPVTYCLVPRELAGKLHEPLRRHFLREGLPVEVVVEQRGRGRRAGADRRGAGSLEPAVDRRRIMNPTGRRVGERRASFRECRTPSLPRRAQRYVERLLFVKRLEPSTQQTEDLDSARLVTRFQAGDREAFGALYTRYFDRVYSYLRVALNDGHAAEDATQQVFLKAFEGLPRYERRPGQPFRGWLFILVRNHTIDELGRLGRIDVLDPEELSRRRAEAAPENGDLEVLNWISDRELVLFIERLPLPQRQALLLRFMLGLSNAEIAEVLGRSPVDVRKLQHRGLAFLRARLTAIGRKPESRERTRIHRRLRQAPVLRWRRFALMP